LRSEHHHHASPAATDPRKQQESELWRAVRASTGLPSCRGARP
jgi:hypothetical protein